MLAKKYRFQTDQNLDFFRRGRRWRGRFFDVLYFDTKTDQLFQNALIVSKKVSNRAVVRNRLRRLVTPLLQQELKTRGDFWLGKILVIVFKSQAVGAETENLVTDWQNFLADLR